MPKPRKRTTPELLRDLIYRDRCDKMEKAIMDHVPVNVLACLIVSYSFTPIVGKTMNATFNITNGRFLYTHRDLLYKKHPKLFPGFKPTPVKTKHDWLGAMIESRRRRHTRMLRYSHIWGD
jgi:hypothetical protein